MKVMGVANDMITAVTVLVLVPGVPKYKYKYNHWRFPPASVYIIWYDIARRSHSPPSDLLISTVSD